MKIDQAIDIVKEKLPQKRFEHSLRVAETLCETSGYI